MKIFHESFQLWRRDICRLLTAFLGLWGTWKWWRQDLIHFRGPTVKPNHFNETFAHLGTYRRAGHYMIWTPTVVLDYQREKTRHLRKLTPGWHLEEWKLTNCTWPITTSWQTDLRMGNKPLKIKEKGRTECPSPTNTTARCTTCELILVNTYLIVAAILKELSY